MTFIEWSKKARLISKQDIRQSKEEIYYNEKYSGKQGEEKHEEQTG